MYAIRSYYETLFLATAMEQLDQVSQQLPQVIEAWRDGDGPALRRLLSEEMGPPALQAQLERRRITSYNVCYTKLLRDRFLPRGDLPAWFAALRQAGFALLGPSLKQGA